MNLQTLVVVVLRLTALQLLVQMLVQLLPLVLQLLSAIRPGLTGIGPEILIVPWIVVHALLVAAVGIWVFALPIARFVTRGTSQEVSFGALSAVDCYSIALITFGIYSIVTYFPQVLNWSHYLLKRASSSSSGEADQVNGYELTQAFIPFIIGVALFLNGRKWAVTIVRRQSGDAKIMEEPKS